MGGMTGQGARRGVKQARSGSEWAVKTMQTQEAPGGVPNVAGRETRVGLRSEEGL